MIEATCSDSVQRSHSQSTVVVTPKAATFELTQVYSIIIECFVSFFTLGYSFSTVLCCPFLTHNPL